MRDHPEACSEIRSHLPLYVGGDLDAPVLSAVAEHLQGCDACREVLRGAESARNVMAVTLGPPPGLKDGQGLDLWPGLREQLRAEGLFTSDNEAGERQTSDAGTLTPAFRADPKPHARVSGRSRWLAGPRLATLGTLAAAAAIVGMVWLGDLPVQVPSNTGVPTGASNVVEPIVVSTETGSQAGHVNPVTPVNNMRPHPASVSSGNRLAGYGGESGGGVSSLGHDAGQGAPRVASEEVDKPVGVTQPGAGSGGLRRVEEGESRLLPPRHVQPVGGVPWSLRQVRQGAPGEQAAGYAPPRHRHIR